MYNKAQVHERRRVAPTGCSTDWFAVSEAIARESVAAFDPAAADLPAPFQFTNLQSSPTLYREQRMIFDAAHDGRASREEVEEGVIHLVGNVLAMAYGHRNDAQRSRNDHARRDLVERAKEVIARSYTEELGVQEIARRCESSTFHLCRTFRMYTGQTLHGHRRDVRLRVALGLLGDHRRDLSALAIDLGFSSHSHFSKAFREHFGRPPAVMSRR
jgi:AraC-like DNA-binding protein